MRPLDEIDFEERDWVPYSGWPFSKSHLDPYYHRPQAICKIEPPTYATEVWEDPQESPRLPFIGDSVKTVIFKFGSRYPFSGGWHHMGTTRMHVDPKQGVVDKNCRVHGISNLFIAGPSVFPTGGYANPSLTIVALAVRLADHIKRELRTTRHFLVRQGRRKYER